MKLAKDIKQIINQIPDDMPVSIGGSYDCDIIGFSFNTSEGFANLLLSDGFIIVAKEFMDRLFNQLYNKR